MSRVFNYRHKKVGGVHFFRLGRFQLSFCLCRRPMVVDENTELYFQARSRRNRVYKGGRTICLPFDHDMVGTEIAWTQRSVSNQLRR